MTEVAVLDDGSHRVIVQFLEGGAASQAIEPDAAVARLRRAGDIIPIADICVGWALPRPLVEAVASEAHRQGASVWLWHPLLSGDGDFAPSVDAVVGPDGTPIPAPRGMGEFSFDCAVRRSGLERALERLQRAAAGGAWDGVFLDKIRWPSPSRDPSADLTCFCEACRAAAGAEGIDMDLLVHELQHAVASTDARLRLVEALLIGTEAEPLASFLRWRSARISSIVRAAAEQIISRKGADGRPMRVALDVFAPSLARSVGQDIPALAALGEFTKGMLYLGTHGPAGISFELCRLSRWLADGGVASPESWIGDRLGYPLPREDILCRASLGITAFEVELASLLEQAGSGSAAGIDAVSIAGLAVLDDVTFERAARSAVSSGAAVVLSWDLWSVPRERLELLARSIGSVLAPGGGT